MEKKELDISKIIYIDMDDTLCDYTKHYNSYKILYPNNQYPQSIYKFFETIPPIPKAIETVKKLNAVYDVWILTRPSVFNPLCYTEKRNWIEQHLGIEYCHKLIISPNKTLLKGGYLIDDVKWDFDGVQLQYGTSKYKDWNDISKYFLSTDLREIKIAIATDNISPLINSILKNIELYFSGMIKYNSVTNIYKFTAYTNIINNVEEFIFGENYKNEVQISPIIMRVIIEKYHISYDDAQDIILFFINMHTDKIYSGVIISNYDELLINIQLRNLVKC